LSALGQKQTFRDVGLMSALPSIADIVWRGWNVRYVPITDMPCLLDHLVGAGDQQRRHDEANGSRGLEIDDQFEFGGLLDR
jgi:hypothetical protein